MSHTEIWVGSYALHLHDSSVNYSDKDVWGMEPTSQEVGIDYSSMPSDILYYIKTHPLSHYKLGKILPPKEVLLTITLSHLGWDIKWKKHVNTALKLLDEGWEADLFLFRELSAYWRKTHHNKPYLSLYKTKDEFFKDTIALGVVDGVRFGYKYDHDRLHRLVAGKLDPVYSAILKDGHEVAVSRTKFNFLPKDYQLRMFKEEIAVIAFERFIVSGACSTWEAAWARGLHKTITDLTKNWASEFMCYNIKELVLPDFNMLYNLIELPEAKNVIEKIVKDGPQEDSSYAHIESDYYFEVCTKVKRGKFYKEYNIRYSKILPSVSYSVEQKIKSKTIWV